MDIGQNISLQSVNLSSVSIPVASAGDFTLSFYLVSPRFTHENREAVGQAISSALPELRYSTYGSNPENIAFTVQEKRAPGFCRHLVTLFQNAGVHVSAMGTTYQEHPLFAKIPALTSVPKDLETFDAFKAALCRAVNAATSTSEPILPVKDGKKDAKASLAL